MKRRTFVKTLGASTVSLTLAGCGGGGGGTDTPGGGGTDTPAGGETTTGGGETATGGEETATGGTETADGTETITGTEQQPEGRTGQIPPGIRVRNLRVRRTDGGARVTGVIANTGERRYEELEVQVTLFDESDEVLGRVFFNTEEEDVEAPGPQQQFEFSVDFTRADLRNVASYRVDVDTDADQDFDVDWGTETGTSTGTSTETSS